MPAQNMRLSSLVDKGLAAGPMLNRCNIAPFGRLSADPGNESEFAQNRGGFLAEDAPGADQADTHCQHQSDNQG